MTGSLVSLEKEATGGSSTIHRRMVGGPWASDEVPGPGCETVSGGPSSAVGPGPLTHRS